MGPAQGAHRKPVAKPSSSDCTTLARPSRSPLSTTRLPKATNGREAQSARRRDSSASPKIVSIASAAQRPQELTRTAQEPPTAASVATPAKVSAMPISSGSVLVANERPPRANTNGSTGRMQGLTIVSAPPRNAKRARIIEIYLLLQTRDRHGLCLVEDRQ